MVLAAVSYLCLEHPAPWTLHPVCSFASFAWRKCLTPAHGSVSSMLAAPRSSLWPWPAPVLDSLARPCLQRYMLSCCQMHHLAGVSVLQEEIEVDILGCLSVGDFGLLGVTTAEHVQLLQAAAVSPQYRAASAVASPCCMVPNGQEVCNEPKAPEQAGGCQAWHPLAVEPSTGEQACCLLSPVAAADSLAVVPTTLAPRVGGWQSHACMPACSIA